VLNTIASSATAAYLAANANERLRAEAIVHGYSVATEWGVAILVLGAIVAAVLINSGRPSASRHGSVASIGNEKGPELEERESRTVPSRAAPRSESRGRSWSVHQLVNAGDFEDRPVRELAGQNRTGPAVFSELLKRT
jgi:hypothetical protein